MNLFDTANYPSQIPSALVAGDRWAWKRSAADYGSGYTFTTELTPAAGGTPTTVTATLSGDHYIYEVSSADTAEYASGAYTWVEMVSRDSDGQRVRLSYGKGTISPDPAASTADTRSHAQKVLAAVEAVIEGRASIDQMSYQIGNRSLSRTPLTDLILLRDKYRAEVRREEQAEKLRNGMASGSQIVVRMR
jgi:hypothetical protein